MKLLRIEEVSERAGWKKTKIYAMMKDGSFPKPVKQGRYSRWLDSDIDAWIESIKSQQNQTGVHQGV